MRARPSSFHLSGHAGAPLRPVDQSERHYSRGGLEVVREFPIELH